MKMYNLNVSLNGPPFLGIDGGVCSTTPRTPEILNSLIAMTSPLEYSFQPSTQSPSHPNDSITITTSGYMTNGTETGSTTVLSPLHYHQVQISQDSHSSCSGSPLDSSPAGTNAPPSVQQTCSQLIKAGLKLSLEMKRKHSSGGDSSGAENSLSGICGTNNITYVPASKIPKREFLDTSDDEMDSKSPKLGLTPEDEDRRRRRRERNKIAATKCRMKKRERTQNLVSESEELETANVNLKKEVQSLEMARRQLIDMLQEHGPKCLRQDGFQLPSINNLPIAKYLDDQMLNEPQQPHRNAQPIPPVNTIKYGHKMKQTAKHQMSANHDLVYCQQPVKSRRSNGIVQTNLMTDEEQMVSGILPTGYCKPSPTDETIQYLVGSDVTTFTDSITDHLTNVVQQMKPEDYIPNCEGSDSGSHGSLVIGTDFSLKNELIDTNSPYTTVQSADRFLFDGSETFDSEISTSRSIKDHIPNNLIPLNSSHLLQPNSQHHNSLLLHQNNNNTTINLNQNGSITPGATIIEFNGSLQSFDSSLLKSDFLTHSSDFLTLTDGSDTQFTDLDSGVTTYTTMTTTTATATNGGGGCLA